MSLRTKIVKYLIKTGYKRYGFKLCDFDVITSQQSHTCCDPPIIAIGAEFNSVPMSKAEKLQTVGFLVRHELAHNILNHFDRLIPILEKEGKDFDSDAWNRATDFEISNYYLDSDNEFCRKMGACVIQDNPHFYNLKAEEIYEQLKNIPNNSDDSDKDGIQKAFDDWNKNVNDSMIKQAQQQIQNGNSSGSGNQNPPDDLANYTPALEDLPQVTTQHKVDIVDKIGNMLFNIYSTDIFKERSYKKINKKYQDSEFIKKGSKTARLPIRKIAVYVDVSGSFNVTKQEKALECLNSLEADKNLEIEKYYFSDYVTEAPKRQGGCTRYGEVLKHIRNNKFEHVLIITDNDTDYSLSSTNLKSFVALGVNCKSMNDICIDKAIICNKKFFIPISTK